MSTSWRGQPVESRFILADVDTTGNHVAVTRKDFPARRLDDILLDRESSTMDTAITAKFVESLPEEVRELTEVVHEQLGQPALLLPYDVVRAVVERLGGLAFSAPIPNLTGTQPFMLPAPLLFFYGLASPMANEAPHMHPLQDEMYIPDGELEVEAWVNSHRRTFVASAGDAVIVPRGSFHLVKTLRGMTHVVKAPQIWGEAAKIPYKG
jgi:hypothetical protein